MIIFLVISSILLNLTFRQSSLKRGITFQVATMILMSAGLWLLKDYQNLLWQIVCIVIILELLILFTIVTNSFKFKKEAYLINVQFFSILSFLITSFYTFKYLLKGKDIFTMAILIGAGLIFTYLLFLIIGGGTPGNRCDYENAEDVDIDDTNDEQLS